MATMTLRDLDEGTRHALRVRAAQNDRSMEAEIRAILRSAVRPRPAVNWFDRARAAAAGAVFEDDELQTLRGADVPRSAQFGEDEASE
jgi:plasmid stability protein